MKRTLREVYRCLSDLVALQPELFSNKTDETENSSEKQIPDKQLPETPAKWRTTYKNIRVVNVTGRRGRGWVITGVRSPAQLRKEEEGKRHSLEVRVPSNWYGRPWSYVMTFDEAQKALDSEETKQAVALMKKIDKQLGIEAELTSGIDESPDGANVVIIHDIKTPVDSDTLRHLAAVKGKVLREKSPKFR
jgi:hypothetical protein